jgi:hypothetical protein
VEERVGAAIALTILIPFGTVTVGSPPSGDKANKHKER